MAFTFTNFAQPTTAAEFPQYGDLISKLLGGYTEGTKAQFLRPTLEEELKKIQLANKYYGPNMESIMGLRGAQTTGQNITNKYLPESLQNQNALLKAQTGSAEANAAKAALMQQMIQGILSGNQPVSGGQQAQAPQYAPGQGVGMLNAPQEASIQQNNQQPYQGLTFPQAALMSHYLGLGQPKFIDVNGKQIAVTPFGNVQVAQGLSEQGKELAKQDAKKISDLESIVINSAPKQDTLNQISNIISSPEFQQMRQHPLLGKHELGWYAKFGTLPQQQMVGNFLTNTGNIIKDSARDFAGQFRIGEQALLQSMKPNASDSLGVIQGKTESLMLMMNMLVERSRLEADLMRNQGMSAIQAKEQADKTVNANAIKAEIKAKINPRKLPDLSHLSDEELRRKAGV